MFAFVDSHTYSYEDLCKMNMYMYIYMHIYIYIYTHRERERERERRETERKRGKERRERKRAKKRKREEVSRVFTCQDTCLQYDADSALAATQHEHTHNDRESLAATVAWFTCMEPCAYVCICMYVCVFMHAHARVDLLPHVCTWIRITSACMNPCRPTHMMHRQ
jgi:hypothetical protein